jgi:transposase
LWAHKTAAVRTAIEATGATVLFLPPYSPDFNPIELAFAKFKAALRRVGPRTQPHLDATITETIDCIAPHEARAFMNHCGYRSLDPP